MHVLSSADFFKRNYRSGKQFGSRSGPAFCRSLSGSKLFAKNILQQTTTLAASQIKKQQRLFALLAKGFNFLKGSKWTASKTIDLQVMSEP